MTLPVAVLAGGLATRLGEITRKIPKLLLDVAGRPFAEHQLQLLQRHGVQDVVYCVGHLGEMVQEQLGDGSHWGMQFHYVFDGPTLLGTGGALRRALPYLGDSFFVLYGDSYLECDYTQIENSFHDSGLPALMTVYHNRGQYDRSNVSFRDGKIIRYSKTEDSPDFNHIDYGLGVLKSDVIAAYPQETKFDLAEVYTSLVGKKQMAGVEIANRFYEIGSIKGLSETEEYLRQQDKGILS